MTKTIRARFSHGVIEPIEKLEFHEGGEITITIGGLSENAEKKKFSDALDDTFGSWADLVDCEELKKNIYADRQISTRPEVKL